MNLVLKSGESSSQPSHDAGSLVIKIVVDGHDVGRQVDSKLFCFDLLGNFRNVFSIRDEMVYTTRKVCLDYLSPTVWSESLGSDLVEKVLNRFLPELGCAPSKRVVVVELDTTVANDAVCVVWCSSETIQQQPDAESK